MLRVFASGPRAAVEAASDAVSALDPNPAGAISIWEHSRIEWKFEAYCEADDDAALAAEAVRASGLDAVVAPLEDQDWIALSLEGLPAVDAGPFRIAGAHALGEDRGRRQSIWIEAGAAFGTGHHGTTLGCVEALWEVMLHHPVRTVLDVGTGTGVLAIAALKLGARSAVASDLDPVAVKVTAANAKNNGVGARLRTVQAPGCDHPDIRRRAPFDLVMANILFRPLRGMAGDLSDMTKPGGRVIVSGLLNFQRPLARAAFEARGLLFEQMIRHEHWITLTFKKPGRP